MPNRSHGVETPPQEPLDHNTLLSSLKGATIELWPDDTGLTASTDGVVVDVVRIGDTWHLVAVAD